MKRKVVIIVLVAAIIALGAISVFALDIFAPKNAASVTARFNVSESNETGDVFSMVSEDGAHVIHIAENTVVQFEGYVPLGDEDEGVTKNVREVLFGRTLAEVLEGRNLRVLYDESNPTKPISVTILFETAVTLPQEISPEDGYIGIMTLPGEINVEDFGSIEFNGEIVVNNEILEGTPAPFWYETETGGVVMVPLNAVAEALGYNVSMNADLQSIQIGVAIHLWIGGTEVHFGRMAPIELSAAPILVDDVTFVPLDFFRNVLGQTAYAFEGQVVIETYSDMM